MSIITRSSLLTTDDLLALPDDGKERWLIRGELREKVMTKRNRFHATLEARIAQLIGEWVDRQPAPRGEVCSGEVGCILQHDPDTTVGIDVAYFSADVLGRQNEKTSLVDGVPVLAVEILSPNDTVEEIDSKVEAYLSAGVALVWIVNPRLRTVQVYRPGTEPVLFNLSQELSAEPHLPGFRVPVARVFSR
jgi:Uma2 family endonuclease